MEDKKNPGEIFNKTRINSKSQLVVVIIAIVSTVLTVVINNTITKITASEQEVKQLAIGNQILLIALIIIQMIRKIDDENETAVFAGKVPE